MLQTGRDGYPVKSPLEGLVSATFDEFDLDIRLGESGTPSLHLCKETQPVSGCGPIPPGGDTALCPEKTIGCTVFTCDACLTKFQTCGETCNTCGKCEPATSAKTCDCVTKEGGLTCKTCATECATQCEQATCAKGTCVTCKFCKP